MKKFIYLAIPYTWNPQLSFEIANKISAILMESNYIVFSPISHSHPISEYVSFYNKYNSYFWLEQDLKVLDRCDELHIVRINESFGDTLINESFGCQEEIRRANELNIPIKYQDFICKI